MSENHAIDDLSGAPLRRRVRRPWRRTVGVTVAVVLVALGVWGWISFHRVMQNFGHPECQDYLRQFGLLCKMWEVEHDGQLPRLSDVPGEFMFNPGVLSNAGDSLRGYAPKTSILTCPRSSNFPPGAGFPGDTSYVYLGPGLETEQEALAFLDAYAQAARAREPLPMPDYDPHAYDSVDLAEKYRLLSLMPVAFDRPKNHDYKGINVLFADGHVEWREMDTGYPATKAFWDKLAEIESDLHEHVGQP